MNWKDLSKTDRNNAFRDVLLKCFSDAEDIVNGRKPNDLPSRLGAHYASAVEIGQMVHAAAGVLLTLSAFKKCNPSQDICAHKDEYKGGFSARSYDTAVTVPFLIEKELPRSVESHWLTQSFSFAKEFRHGLEIKTQPKKAGPLLIDLVVAANADPTGDIGAAIATAVFKEKIDTRNKGKVVLTRPKDLSIEDTLRLLKCHFLVKYRSNAPRLPQLATYAVYECLMKYATRYADCTLDKLERMKSADRKAKTVGDVVVRNEDGPFEAVELKFEQCINAVHLEEAIDKVRALSVRRYYILSTQDVCEDDAATIEKRRSEFLKQNGCEIIVNGIYSSLSYYLRLLPNTSDFIFSYANHIETDEDTNYEHRIAWNECCKNI